MASLFAVAGMFGESIWWLIAVAFCIGATCNPLYPLLLAYTNDHLSVEQMPSASGGLLFINGVGAMGGPMIVGFLINSMGPDGFFVFIAILTALICLYSLYRMSRRVAVAVEDTHSYIPVTATATSVAVEMATEVAYSDEEPTRTTGSALPIDTLGPLINTFRVIP